MTAKRMEADDYGIGDRAASSDGRLLNPDGSFNVKRRGLSWVRSLNLYHALTTMSTARFCLSAVAAYLAVNGLFAVGYLLCGRAAIAGLETAPFWERLAGCFFFSVETFSTIGYGTLAPLNRAAHVLVVFEAMVGLASTALATGLVFARFSRPQAKLLCSKTSVVSPHQGGQAWMFRMANGGRSQLMDVEAKVVLATRDPSAPSGRRFDVLQLERSRIMMFPLHWVVVHPIDEESPMFGLTREEFETSAPEFLILTSAVDETFADSVYARTSYSAEQIEWNARFSDIYSPTDDGAVAIDLSRLDETEPVR